jgi:hypothetical protein
MRAQLGYDRAMRHWTLVFALLVLSMLAASAHAQANGVPPSVTSFGFGGHPDFGGTPPSVTSVGPKGLGPVRPGPRPGPVGPGRIHQPPSMSGSTPGHRHHDHNQTVVYPYFIPYYPVVDPYAYGGPDIVQGAAAAGEDTEDPDQYQGGPTIFDRRGPGTPEPNDYATQEARVSPPPKPAPAPDPAEASVALAPERPQVPVASQPDTILIFKDGHKQQVGNYAIVGTNLFDLTPGHRQKIALSDLDLPATQKANDDQGNDFKLPGLPDGN